MRSAVAKVPKKATPKQPAHVADLQPTKLSAEDELLQFMVECQKNPLKFVRYAFPWKCAGTELEDHDGPDKWQEDILRDLGKGLINVNEAVRIAVASGHGIGKALAHGEPVLTPTGWVPIEQIKVGDLVVAGDGSATKVVGVFPQGVRALFRVTTEDGCSVVVDGDHQWLTTNRSERKHGKPGCVRTTSEIAETLTFPNGAALGLNHQLPRLGAVQHPVVDLPIEPYLLGCWLGDGDAKGRITGMEETFTQLRLSGASLGKRGVKQGTDAVYHSVLGIRDGLRSLGVFGCRAWEKHIPTLYMHSSSEQRIALLQGLLDTDGHTNGHGNVAFEVVSPALADGVAELVRSLGGVVRRSEKVGSYGGKMCRRVYRLFISLPQGVAPFRVPRKAARYTPQWGSMNCERTRDRHISAVEPVGEGLATCIAVANPSHLFVTKGHIVTHNSALVSWIILWAMSTMEDTKGVVTANTESQLKSKTWAELAKWHRLAVNSHWFEFTATAIYSTQPGHDKTWRVDQIAWSETRSEAFAGLHNKGRRVLLLFDEASAIPDMIWEVAEGALTDEGTEIVWACFGNPTRGRGRFRECFGRFAHRWITRNIDSRTAKMTNKAQAQQWIDDYGIDSDFVKVRVLGQFPSVDANSLFSVEELRVAMSREYTQREIAYAPRILGVDVARQGMDDSAWARRQGLVVFPVVTVHIPDTMLVAQRVRQAGMNWCEPHEPDAVFVDATGGYGAGVVDAYRALGSTCTEVYFSGSATDPRYFNKRAEMYFELKTWLKKGGALPRDEALLEELAAITYEFKGDKFKLCDKEDVREEIGRSPDRADAVALTFAYAVTPKQPSYTTTPHTIRRAGRGFDYNPLED